MLEATVKLVKAKVLAVVFMVEIEEENEVVVMVVEEQEEAEEQEEVLSVMFVVQEEVSFLFSTEPFPFCEIFPNRILAVVPAGLLVANVFLTSF